jgi:tetratricopeptide (TPR) repeat protein
MSRSYRLYILALSTLLVAGPACTTTGSGGPTVSPRSATPVISADEIPPAPAGTAGPVASTWASLRAGDPVAAPLADDSAAGATLEGFRQLRMGDAGAARAAFDLALSDAAAPAAAAYGMGLVARSQGQTQVARQWFDRALQMDPTLARADLAARRLSLDGLGALLSRAEALEDAGDLEAAAAEYRAAIEAAPWAAGSYVRLADLRGRTGGGSAAVPVLEEGRRRTADAPVLLDLLAEAYLRQERFADASEVLDRLVDLRPDDATARERAADARARYEEAVLPQEYRSLASREVVTREELAAALAINLQGLRPPEDSARGTIIADVGDRWSAPFVQRMVDWRILDIYQNNTFWPEMEVRRSMLVEAAWRVLQNVGAADSAPRVQIQDPPPEHLLYRPVQAVVGLGIMEPRGDGDFDLLDVVSGAEVLETVRRLAAVVRERQT